MKKPLNVSAKDNGAAARRILKNAEKWLKNTEDKSGGVK